MHADKRRVAPVMWSALHPQEAQMKSSNMSQEISPWRFFFSKRNWICDVFIGAGFTGFKGVLYPPKVSGDKIQFDEQMFFFKGVEISNLLIPCHVDHWSVISDFPFSQPSKPNSSRRRVWLNIFSNGTSVQRGAPAQMGIHQHPTIVGFLLKNDSYPP